MRWLNEKIRGFTKQTYVADSSIEYIMYTKNSVIVVQNRVPQANESDLILFIPNNFALLNPMNGKIGNTACSAASKKIKSSSEHSASWKYKHIDGIHSTVGGLQIFSDESRTSLSFGTVQFYPFHESL